MISSALAGMVIGVSLIILGSTSKEEKWQTAYGIVGLIAIFWSMGLFNLAGGKFGTLTPAVTMLFGLFSMYTKGNAQLLSIIVTIILLQSLFFLV